MSNPVDSSGDGTDPTLPPREAPGDHDSAATVLKTPAPSGPGPTPQPAGTAGTASGSLPPTELPNVDPRLYTVGQEIARGGMGRILAARDRRLGRTVALKELLTETADLSARFLREALLTARLQHPGIVPVYEAGTWPGGAPFFAMRLVSGRSLKDAVAACSSLAERFALLPHCIDAVEAVAYAHGQKIIHRDLKPANVLVGNYGETVVIDWGLAKEIKDGAAVEPLPAQPDTVWATGHTVSGSVMGSPAYMAPEQARGEPVDERTDVYALGAMLYHVLAGEPPYDGRTGQEVVEKVVAGPPERLLDREPELPVDLAAIVEKAMARGGGQRYRSARELAEDLRSFQTGNLVGAHRYSTRMLLRRWMRAHRTEVLLVAAAAAALAVLGAWGVGRVVEERARVAEVEKQYSRTLAQQTQERGRSELLAGRPLRALPLLAEARRAAAPSPALEFLLARALRPADAQLLAFEGHQGSVTAVAFSPDGRLLLSAARDGAANLWDPGTGALLGRLGRPGGRALTLASFDPSGQRIVAGGADESVQLFSASTREPVASLSGHAGGALAAVFRPDGMALATVARERGSAFLWETLSGRQVASLGDGARSAAFSADGALLATGRADGSVQLASGSDGAPGALLRGPAGEVTLLAFRPDGRRLATVTDDGAVRLWDPSRDAPIATLAEAPSTPGEERRARSLAFSPDGEWLVVAGATTRLWHADGAPGPELDETADGVFAVAFAPGSAQLATAGLDGTARLWDLSTGSLLAALTASSASLTSLAFDPAGGRLVTGGLDKKPRLWDLSGRNWLDVPEPHEGGAALVRYAADGATLFTSGRDGAVRAWDTETLARRFQVGGALGSTAAGLVASLDGGPATVREATTGKALPDLGGAPVAEALLLGEGAAALVGRDGKGSVWSTAGTRIVELDGAELRGLSAGAGGRRFAARVGRFAAAVWDASGRQLALVKTPDEQVAHAALSADGEQLVTAHAGGTAQLWEAATGRRLQTLRDEGGEVEWAAFSPSADLVATSDGRNTVRIWQAQGGRQLSVLGRHRGRVRAIVFAPDGERIATAGDDRRVLVWEARTGDLLAVLAGFGGPVLDAAFSPEGELLATACADGRVRVWDVHLEGRSNRDVAAKIRCRVPYRLEGGLLLPAAPETSSCAP